MAEIESSIFQRGCFSRRLDCLGTLRRRIHTLERTRNQERCSISWQFTTNKARLKLPHLKQENAHRLDIWSLKAVHAQRVANFSAVMQVVFNHMPDDPPTGVHVYLAVEFILEDDLQIGGGVAR